ncbi:Fcf2 pre-rRNA processing-domain-containing protein [Linnemannia elongata]|nr:Fcf2 pre-rRNA processing-domain-containing protein [Linnemannia elongata]
MVTTRNRSRNPSLTQAEMELPPPTRPRRARQTKPKPVIVQDAEESETVESSSPTSSPESRSPPSEPEEPLSPVEVLGKSPLNETVSSKKAEQYNEEEDEEEDGDEEEEAQAVPGDEQQSESAESEDDSEEEEGDDDDENLDALLVKAQASLKRKAVFEEKSNEPMFNFPKLQTGLKDKNVYIKQENGRAKVAVDNVVVVDKTNKAGSKAALETCEVNMNAEKVHVSKRQKQEEREKTTGKKWFDMPQQVLTPELRRDLQILRLRNVLDPKRFYKREEKGKPRFPKYFQVGTIIEGNTEFYSSRLSKKERATTITGEVMKDVAGRDYYKRKFDEIQVAKQSGGKKFNKKGKGKQSKSWRK